jgi:hypothetical protein
MADNVAITAGSGTTIAADDISSVMYQRVKLSLGADGVANDANVGAGAVGTGTLRVTVGADEYETVAASQTDQMCGASGAAGDVLTGLLIIPATVSPGAVSIEDGSTNTVVFAGGTDSVLTLHPFYVPLGIVSSTGGWEITTGANVSVIAVGQFT